MPDKKEKTQSNNDDLIRQIKTFIKIEPFFKKYLPHQKNFAHKIRGKNGRNNPLTFSDAEKNEIKLAINKLLTDLLNK